MFRGRLLFYPLFIVFGIIIGIYLAKDIQPETEPKSKENKLDKIINTLDNYYVTDLDKSEIENRIINAMLSELDPHSSYQTKEENQAFEENMKGSFSGIGIEFKIIDDTINVLTVIEGGPCSKIGVKAGDRIISVDGEIVCNINITNAEVVRLLKGEKKSEVKIEVKRDVRKKNIPFEITRNKVPIKSIETSLMINDNIGYIKVIRFSETTYKEISEKFSKLLAKGMEKLILDLRDNRGGYMHIATQICDDFLKKGELIVYTKDKDGNKKERFAKRGMLEETKLAVIINENSASASEIIAGAIQDNDRGIIIGRRSFGKGLVQTPFTLDDGSIIKLTTHKYYYTPSGRCIQKDYQNSKEEYFLENETDTTKYLTKKENIVYGGGGITPNIIVNRQINVDVQRFLKVWITDFCFKYAQKNKQKDYKHFDELDKINLYNDFNSYVTRKEDKLILNLDKKESEYLKNLILASVSKYLFEADSYYEIINTQDEFVKTAVLELGKQ